MKDNKNEEIKFQIEMELFEARTQNNSKKTIKLAEKNLKKMILNRIDGKTGEC